MRMTRGARNLKLLISAASTVSMLPDKALAHASEQALVLLLPTDLYIRSGVAAVALTVVLLAFVPGQIVLRLFGPVTLPRLGQKQRLKQVTSSLAFMLLVLLVWAGLAGPRDPLANPLPLFVWTVFWVGLVTVQAVIGDIWSYANPWTGPLALTRKITGPRPAIRFPVHLAQCMGLASFLGFAYLLLADPAPSDPARLARIVALYWAFTFVMAALFGPRWLRRAEGLSVVLNVYARLALLGRRAGRPGSGLWGWQVVHLRPLSLAPSILIVLLLGTGSFDGLNETFWWLGLNGLNPLEFPGRSAVILQNATGLLAANFALLATLTLCIWAGLRLAGAKISPVMGLRLFAPSILPIALGYHVAHYLPSFLVDSQYALVAMSDPFLTGADYLGLGAHYVSTGFFNTRDTVRVLLLTQAGAVVIGHVLAVLLAHAIAIRTFGTTRRAALSQAPLATFMIAYTLFGLWLLASPRF